MPPQNKGKVVKAQTKKSKGGFGCFKLFTLTSIAAVAIVGKVLHSHFPKDPYPTNIKYETHYMEDVYEDMSVVEELKQMVRDQGSYSTAKADLTSPVSDIGEAAPAGSEACKSPYLINDQNNTKCFLPSRFDIVKHHLTTGGPDAYRESFKVMQSRTQPFLSYMFDKFESPIMKQLFTNPRYVERARSVCAGRDYFDGMQLNMVIILPGQDLPMHLDVPWFWGGNRFTLPQWLLVAMEMSGIFKEFAIPQIQGVMWLHDAPEGAGGDFFFYPDGEDKAMKKVTAKKNALIVADGCRVVHGVSRFKPDRDLPYMDKDKENQITLNTNNDTWTLTSDGRKIGEYTFDDVRVSLVWRARCFKDQAEKTKYDSFNHDWSVEDVLTKLVAELRKRGRLGKDEPRPEPLELALLILDEFVRYPTTVKDKTWFPLNYCFIFKDLFPGPIQAAFNKALSPFCGKNLPDYVYPKSA